MAENVERNTKDSGLTKAQRDAYRAMTARHVKPKG
jgi:hypothetical protein